MKNELLAFDINIHGLEDKSYEYDFEGSNAFFEAFEQDIIESGDFKAKVKLDKTPNLIRLNITILACVGLICDRSLEPFSETYNITEKYIYKFGDKADIVSDELEVIPYGTPKINISELLFEFILLHVPIKKLHPKYRDEENNEEDGMLVYRDPASEVEETKKEDAPIDPRWAALLKLKNN